MTFCGNKQFLSTFLFQNSVTFVLFELVFLVHGHQLFKFIDFTMHPTFTVF